MLSLNGGKLLALCLAVTLLCTSCGVSDPYAWQEAETPTSSPSESLRPDRVRDILEGLDLEDGDRFDIIEGGILLNGEMVYIGGTAPLQPADYGFHFYGVIDIYRDSFWIAVIDVATGRITFIQLEQS